MRTHLPEHSPPTPCYPSKGKVRVEGRYGWKKGMLLVIDSTAMANNSAPPPFVPPKQTTTPTPLNPLYSVPMLGRGWLATKGVSITPGVVVTNTGDKQ